MKFSADTSVLLDAMKIAHLAVPTKTTIQVIQNFLLRLDGNFLEIYGTDLDLGIKIKVEVLGQENGEIVVNAHRLLDIIKTQPSSDTNMTIEVDDYLVKIVTNDGFEAELTGFDSNEYPDFPEISEDGNSAQVTSGEVAFLTEKAAFAVSNDNARLSLNGVFCTHEEGKMLFVATDGHRLGKAFLEHPSDDWEEGVILPPKVLNCLLKVATDSNAQLDMNVDTEHIMFASDNFQIVSKLIEGPYPKYQNVIPPSFENEAIINADNFTKELIRVSAIATARTKQIKLHINNDKIIVSTRNPDIGGNTKGELSVNFNGNDAMDIGFNANYLLEILRKCPCEEIALKFNTALGACIIEPIGEGMDFLFLIMPLRLPD